MAQTENVDKAPGLHNLRRPLPQHLPQNVSCAGLMIVAPAAFACAMTTSTFAFEDTLCPSVKVRGARAARREAGIVGDAPARPQGQPQAHLHLEEGDRPVFGRLPDDPLRRQAEPIAVKAERPFEVIDAERDDGDTWFHAWSYSWRGNAARG